MEREKNQDDIAIKKSDVIIMDEKPKILLMEKDIKEGNTLNALNA